MSTGEHDADTAVATQGDAGHGHAHDEAEPKRKLDLEVEITDAGPCKKHLKVAIAKAEVDRQFTESLGELRKEAQVPGFRPGRAPKTLVERRFKKQVAGQVKQALLMTCLEQLDEDHKLKPITAPQLDVEAIELPEDGPLRFEMDVEVQPDFPLPAYKALSVKRPVREVTEADVDAQQTAFLERYAQLVPKLEGGAAIGDYVTANIDFSKGGIALSNVKEIQFRLQPELRFQDGHVPDLFGALGRAKPGETVHAKARIGSSSPDPALRNQEIDVAFEVLDLKVLRLPEVDAAFLRERGFEDLADLRSALKGMLARRHEFQQRQAIRNEILGALVAETKFDLPADLVARQERNTTRRLAMEMKQGGASDGEIRAREAEIRANAHEETTRSLKEFFILSQIAEAEGVKVEESDFEDEIEAIAARTDDSPRRVRARIEKDNLGDALASQILERKALDRIIEFVKFEDVAAPTADAPAVETLDETATTAPEAGPGAEAAAESPDAPA